MRALWRAAFVIARRDFTAVVLSRTFILFLLGPLLPIVIGFAFGGLGERISRSDLRPAVGVALAPAETAAMLRAEHRLVERMGADALPHLQKAPLAPDPRAQLANPDSQVVAIISGSLTRPMLTGKPEDLDRLQGDISLLATAALAERTLRFVPVERQEVATSLGAQAQARLLIGRAAQVVIFFLTILLAGMILSNLVEEKTNKIIEILAAAVPIDAIFLGPRGCPRRRWGGRSFWRWRSPISPWPIRCWGRCSWESARRPRRCARCRRSTCRSPWGRC